jgi:selenocysteine lyase/cysteine desulfurase
MYVSDETLKAGYEHLLLDMRNAKWDTENSYKSKLTARRFELWEVNYANLLVFAHAIKCAFHIGLDNIRAYNSDLTNLLKTELKNKTDAIITEEGSKSSSIVTFTSNTKSVCNIQSSLNAANITYSVVYRHFTFIYFNKKNVEWIVRISLHYFN